MLFASEAKRSERWRFERERLEAPDDRFSRSFVIANECAYARELGFVSAK